MHHRPQPAWSPSRNPLAKLTSGPKHHLVDPALAIALLGLDRQDGIAVIPAALLGP